MNKLEPSFNLSRQNDPLNTTKNQTSQQDRKAMSVPKGSSEPNYYFLSTVKPSSPISLSPNFFIDGNTNFNLVRGSQARFMIVPTR